MDSTEKEADVKTGVVRRYSYQHFYPDLAFEKFVDAAIFQGFLQS